MEPFSVITGFVHRPQTLALALFAAALISPAASASSETAAPPLLDAAPQEQSGSLEGLSFPALPQAAPTQGLSFPRYARLMPAVEFWSRVFDEYSELQSAVHSTVYPHKVLRLLDFRGQAMRMTEVQLDKHRRGAEQDARDEMEALIRSVHAKRATPQKMSAEERRIFDLFADVRSDKRFKAMLGTIRTQRGLKERTQEALRVSDRYLPYMEKIFEGYGLPTELTRLPIVESSFNLDAYSRSGAAGVWQFIPSSARIYMRLNEIVDDRRDPWTSTDGAARHLRDDYAMLGDWPLAITAYNHGRNGIARGLRATGGKTLVDLIERYDSPRFGFAGKNYSAEFLAALDVERRWREQEKRPAGLDPLEFEVVETRHYVPYDTLRRLCGADDAVFRRLNPAYRPEVIDGRLYVPPGHLIRVPAGSARGFQVAYARLGDHERFERQRVYYLLHKVGKGETLGGIAREYRVSLADVRKANGIGSSSLIRIGQVLKIPPHEEARPGPISVAVGESKPSLTRAQRAAARSESDGSTHVVGRGDTLIDIARRYGVSVDALKQANGLSSSMIRVGQRLSVPAGGSRVASYRDHRVRRGQTLSSIARSYDVSIADLRDANGMGSSSLIKVGQTLRVPAQD
ncbi:MAG: LysM peptidoglycan-binding domain-containing protein [Gammaproteobacteria bacterium]